MKSVKDIFDEHIKHIESRSHGNWEPLSAAILTLAEVLKDKEPPNDNQRT